MPGWGVTILGLRNSQIKFGNDKDLVDVNIEVAMDFVNTGKTYNKNITVVNDIFASTTALTISNDNLDPKLKSIAECQKRLDWVR